MYASSINRYGMYHKVVNRGGAEDASKAGLDREDGALRFTVHEIRHSLKHKMPHPPQYDCTEGELEEFNKEGMMGNMSWVMQKSIWLFIYFLFPPFSSWLHSGLHWERDRLPPLVARCIKEKVWSPPLRDWGSPWGVHEPLQSHPNTWCSGTPGGQSLNNSIMLQTLTLSNFSSSEPDRVPALLPLLWLITPPCDGGGEVILPQPDGGTCIGPLWGLRRRLWIPGNFQVLLHASLITLFSWRQSDKEKMRYELSDMVADIGGYMGLLLGVSCLDFFTWVRALVSRKGSPGSCCQK